MKMFARRFWECNGVEKNMIKSSFAIILLVLISASALYCNHSGESNQTATRSQMERKTDQAPPTPVPENPGPRYNLSAIQSERAYQWLKEIALFDQRWYGSPRRDQAIAKLKKSLSELCDSVVLDPFEATDRESKKTYKLNNIVAKINPDRPNRLLVGSHWDTRLWSDKDPNPKLRDKPIMGANDGTSGLAVIVEILKVLKEKPLALYGLDIVFFDGEDFGRANSRDFSRGAKHYAEHTLLNEAHKPKYGLVIDMVGDTDLNIQPEHQSKQAAPDLMQLIWNAAAGQSAAGFRSDAPLSIIDDHVPLIEAGVPTVLLLDFDYPYWHTQADTVDKVSPHSLEETGKVILQVLYQLDGGAL